MSNTRYQPPITVRQRDRALSAIVSLTTHAPMGAAARLHQGYYRRDWLLFAAEDANDMLPRDAEPIARDLDCDLVAMGSAAPAAPPLLRAGVRLWNRMLWRGGLKLWRDDVGGRCCLIPEVDHDLHLWLETGRVVAHEGLPWRNPQDRQLGFARAAAAFNRLVREG